MTDSYHTSSSAQAERFHMWSRDLDAIMLSEPVVQVVSATDWTISVSGFSRDRGGMMGGWGVPVLFRFRPDGSFQVIRLAR